MRVARGGWWKGHRDSRVTHMNHSRGRSRACRVGSIRRSQASMMSPGDEKNSPVSGCTYFQPPTMYLFTRMDVFTHMASAKTRGEASCTLGAMRALHSIERHETGATVIMCAKNLTCRETVCKKPDLQRRTASMHSGEGMQLASTAKGYVLKEKSLLLTQPRRSQGRTQSQCFKTFFDVSLLSHVDMNGVHSGRMRYNNTARPCASGASHDPESCYPSMYSKMQHANQQC
jgi:hypothetical protein